MNLIPNTKMKVFPVTLGTMTFGTPVGFDEALRLTRYALDKGVNLIDTANIYEGYARSLGSAGGVAEEIVGKAIKPYRREDIYVASKLGMKVGADPEDEGTSPAAIRKQLSVSLKRLCTDYIDLYYLHRPDDSVPIEDILGEIKNQMDAGKLRAYGVSNYAAPQLKALLDAADLYKLPRPVVCQPPLSLLRQDALSDLVPLCAMENIAVIPYQIFQGGLLTGKYRRGAEPPAGSRADEKPDWVWIMDDALFDRLEEIEGEAKARGLAMTQYAIRWALEQSAVVSAIVGVKTTRQIDDAVAAVI